MKAKINPITKVVHREGNNSTIIFYLFVVHGIGSSTIVSSTATFGSPKWFWMFCETRFGLIDHQISRPPVLSVPFKS
jgi:hypothetical protein